MRLATLPESEAREEALGLRVLDSDDSPADPIALARLREGLADADLVAPPVALPDFHFKADKEMPSSIAVATSHTIRPTLTSASVNCGMTLIATDLPRPDAASIADFYRRVRDRYPYPPTYRRDLTTEEVLRCAAEGADYAAARFDVDPAELERVEERGRLDVERYGGLERVRRELPWSVLQLSRIRFGTIGPSNHFAELQEVEEILDGHAAELLGLSLGQTTLQFHGGGGRFRASWACSSGGVSATRGRCESRWPCKSRFITLVEHGRSPSFDSERRSTSRTTIRRSTGTAPRESG